MELKISIKTPKGSATRTEKQIMPYIIGNNSKKLKRFDVYVSPDDDEIVWHLEGDARVLMKMHKNVSLYDVLLKKTLSLKMVKKLVDEKDKKELERMLTDSTSVTIVKDVTPEEQEELSKSWFQKIKEKWKRRKPNP